MEADVGGHGWRMSLTRRSLGFTLALITISLTFGGCASVKVLPQSKVTSAKKALRPQRLIVGRFDFTDGALPRGRRNDAAFVKVQNELSKVLREDLAKALKPLKIEVSEREVAPLTRPQPAWLISGQFARVKEGSRLVRVAIGFGFGASKVETAVKVEDLSLPKSAPVATFRTTSFSGGDPGLILSAGTTPLAAADAALTLVSIIGAGPKDDSKRTARMIAAYVSELLAERGWLDPKLVRRAKK